MLTRRRFIEGLAGSFATVILPNEAIAENEPRRALLKSRWRFEQDELESFVLCADAYKEKGPKPIPETVTFLYPGSGTDVNVLELGVQLLYDTPVNQARFIFTEIGEYETIDFAKANHWHEGHRDAIHEIGKALSKNKPNPFSNINKRRNKSTGWENPAIPNSSITEFDINVRTPDGPKKITLYFAYNAFVDREEPTEEEKRAFTRDLLADARNLYWPREKKPGKIYPSYFLQPQFDQADIIISRQCGDLRLLQFDYVRAFHKTTVTKPRVVLTESLYTDRVIASLQDYDAQRHIVESNSRYGYCMLSMDNCQTTMLVVSKS